MITVLPTGNDIFGGTIEVNDLLGFDLYAEFDRSRRFRKYPNRKFTEHLMDSDEARCLDDQSVAAGLFLLPFWRSL